MKILVLNGPNINMLGIREPDMYGKNTFADLLALLETTAAETNVEIEQYQSNHEGCLIDKIQECYGKVDGIVINPAGYTHTSVAILDALKKHNATATFFVVGHYLESAPELVKRMVQDGHSVGNHTYHHPDMTAISDKAAFQKEMDDVKQLFKEITDTEMSMYYRPPQGKYSLENLRQAKELGYSTYFWSLAYVDWNVDAQPSHEEALGKLTRRVHPGAIVLLHTTSKTNGEIMDELLTVWEEMGYGFGALEELGQ